MTATAWQLWSLPVGVALDALLGDPRGWPHPVRWVGGAIESGESALRRLGSRPAAEYAEGVLLVVVITGLTAGVAWGLTRAATWVGGPAVLAVHSVLIYYGLAIRSLGDEPLRAADEPDLDRARRELAMIVGRDTESLDRAEIGRACVETVAENCNDAVVAPLFWYAVGGPVGLWAFKAVNTLDSMVGYRSDRYRRFGWASARLDDLLGLAPARLTWLLVALGALVRGESAGRALRFGWRDARKHPSPNAGWGEAAMAGAIGVQLGGPATYGGVPALKPRLGDALGPTDAAAVRRSVGVMRAASGFAAASAWVVRAWVIGAFGPA